MLESNLMKQPGIPWNVVQEGQLISATVVQEGQLIMLHSGDLAMENHPTLELGPTITGLLPANCERKPEGKHLSAELIHIGI